MKQKAKTSQYQDSFEILLCGDLNGTLLNTRSNSHDKLLKNFVNETSLLSAGKCSDMNTCVEQRLVVLCLGPIVEKDGLEFDFHKKSVFLLFLHLVVN
jgi:hypothetical protein